MQKILPLFLILFSSILYAQQAVKDSVQKSTFFRKQGDTLYKQGKFLSAANELKKALLFNPKNKIYRRIKINYLIGNNYQESSQLDSAKIYYQNGHNLVHDSMPYKIKYLKNFHLFNYSNVREKVDSAMVYGLRAYDYAHKSNNKIIISKMSTYLGAFFVLQKNFKKGEGYLSNGYKLAKEQKNDDLIYEAEIYLGLLALELGEYKKAEKKLKAALQYFKKTGNMKGVFLANGSLSKVYFFSEQNTKLFNIGSDLFKDLAKFEFSNDLEKIRGTLVKQIRNFSNIEVSDSIRIRNAYDLYNENLNLTPEQGKPDMLKSIIKVIIENKQVLDSLDPTISEDLKKQIYEIVNIQDKVYQDDLKKKYNELEVEYDTEKKEKENILLKKDKERLFWTITFALLIFSGFIYYVIKRRKYIHLQNKLKIGEAKGKQSYGIGLELHGKATRKLDALAQILYQKQESTIANEVSSIKNYIKTLSRNLIQTKFLDTEFDEQLISLVSEIDSHNFSIRLQQLKKIQWKSINQTVKRTLFLVLEEIIINAKKYSNASTLNISFEKRKKKLFISAVDNGKGFNPETIKKGKGIQVIKEEIKEINGEVTIHSTENKGTETKLIIQLV